MKIGGVACRRAGATTGVSRRCATSRAKGRRRCESGVDCRPCRGRDCSTRVERIAAGRSEERNSRRKPEVRSRSSRTIQRRSEPGSWPPVEPESRTADESRGFSSRRSHEDTTASESWRVGRWGSRRMQHRLYCEIIKIETPEASVSGVFNLCRFFLGLLGRATVTAAVRIGLHWMRRIDDAMQSQ
jgi:hypothetical protein